MSQQQSTPGLLAPLVGGHHRPPAKQVLQVLRRGTKLKLEPEPENPYDPKAIKVLVSLGDELPVVQCGALAATLEGTGHELNDLMSSPEPLHLGHIADSDGKPMAKLRSAGFTGVGNREIGELIAQAGLEGIAATLEFGPDGQPQVRVAKVRTEEPAP
jgi:hypothetical protein